MMQRSVTVVFLCMLMLLCSVAWAFNGRSFLTSSNYPPDIAHIKKKGTLVVAMYGGGAKPFFYQNAKGKWTGIDVDLAKMIAEQLGVKLKIYPTKTYDGIIDVVASRKADIGMGLLGITPQRALKVRYSDHYYSFDPNLLFSRVQLAARGWTVWDAAEQMKKANQTIKLGALEKSLSYTMLQDTYPNTEVVPFKNIGEALQAATDGKVLAVIASAPGETEHWFQANPQSALRAAAIPIPEQSVIVGIAVPWQYENLRQWLNVYIEYIKMNHILDNLFVKYNAKGLEN